MRHSFDDFFAHLFAHFAQSAQRTPLAAHLDGLQAAYAAKVAEPLHGDLARWYDVLEQTQHLVPSQLDLSADCLRIGQLDDLPEALQHDFSRLLMQQHPWRKGPFALFGTHIDTEWRSDWKWQRVQPHLAPLAGRHVLDVGCGSGYHVWRMAGLGAASVLGIEPMWQYVLQFNLLKQWVDKIQPNAAHVLPLTLEELPPLPACFDTVLSMGVLYHRRDPLQHLISLKNMLRSGGELLLETLVIDGDVNQMLMPEDRYCRMRNVWFLPSVPLLMRWCERLGFKRVRVVDLNRTTVQEQRQTAWMTYHSLAEALNPHDLSQTVEGLPAPLRVALLMEA